MMAMDRLHVYIQQCLFTVQYQGCQKVFKQQAHNKIIVGGFGTRTKGFC